LASVYPTTNAIYVPSISKVIVTTRHVMLRDRGNDIVWTFPWIMTTATGYLSPMARKKRWKIKNMKGRKRLLNFMYIIVEFLSVLLALFVPFFSFILCCRGQTLCSNAKQHAEKPIRIARRNACRGTSSSSRCFLSSFVGLRSLRLASPRLYLGLMR